MVDLRVVVRRPFVGLALVRTAAGALALEGGAGEPTCGDRPGVELSLRDCDAAAGGGGCEEGATAGAELFLAD